MFIVNFKFWQLPYAKKLAQNQNDFYLILGIKIEFLFSFSPELYITEEKHVNKPKKFQILLSRL